MWVQIHKWEGDDKKCALEKKKTKILDPNK